MNTRFFNNFYFVEWLLASLLAGSLYYHVNLGGTGLRIPNNIVVWFFASLIGFYSLYRFSKQESFYLPRYFALIFAFPTLALLSGILAGIEIPEQWLFRLLYLWGGLLFLFGLYQHPLKQARLDRLLLMIVITGFIHGIVGVMQIFLVQDMPRWLPINISGSPTGLFQQINNQASFQISCVILSFWLFTRPLIRHSRIWLFCLLLFAVFTSIFIVSYSGSRVGSLSFLLATPLLFISRWQFIKTDKKQWLLITLTVLIAISSANLIDRQRGLTTVIDKTTAINAGYSGSTRLGIYSIAIDLIKEEPLWGHGIGSFVRVWQLEKPAFYAKHPDATLPHQRVSHPHNEVIFWLVEGGAVAGLGLLLVVIAVMLSLWRLPHSRRYAYAAMLIPISLHTQVELPFYISSTHWFVFLILLYVSLHPTRKKLDNTSGKSTPIVLRTLVLAGSLTSALFFTHTMAANLEFRNYFLGKSTEDPFQISMQNPYFNLMATHTLMTTLFHSSMKYGVTNNVQIFADWGEQELKQNPHILFYKLTADALLYLKDYERACGIAYTGNAVYPTDAGLKEIARLCQQKRY